MTKCPQCGEELAIDPKTGLLYCADCPWKEEAEGFIFEKGLGGFVPIEKVSDEGLLQAIQELIEEALRRDIRSKLVECLKDNGTPRGKALARELEGQK